MLKVILLVPFFIFFQKPLCLYSAVIDLEQKDSFVDYLPQRLGSNFKPGVIFKQQKYDREGNLKQVDSIAFLKKKHSPQYPDDLVEIDKKTYKEFRQLLNGTNIDVRFVKNVRHVLPFIVSKKYLYDYENFDDIETLSYDGVVTIDSLNLIRQIVNVLKGKNVHVQGLTYNGNDLATNITMKFDTGDQEQFLILWLRNIPLMQLVEIMGVFQQAVTAYKDELEIATFISDNLDLLYPNYDWAVVVDVLGTMHDFGNKEEVKFVSMMHKEKLYTIYTLPNI